MSTVLGERGLPRARARRWVPWLAVAAGLAALYLPTYLALARGLWRDDAYAHGPIVLAVFAWLVWRRRAALLVDDGARAPRAGALVLAAGLALDVVGRSQGLALFETASHIPVLAGVLLVLRGVPGVRRFAFPLAFLVFLVPLPGFVLAALTAPLKAFVSAVVAGVLHLAGYPVARDGVVITVGTHRMLVADACSGLNSIYSLAALGLLYAHLRGAWSRARVAILLAAIVPIALAANVVRVLFLVLVAYHFGDAAAAGPLHAAAGLLLFATALGLLLALDAAIAGRPGAPAPVPARKAARPRARARREPAYALAAAVTCALVAAAAAAPALAPREGDGPAPDLARLVPARFGDWRVDTALAPVPPTPAEAASLGRLYGRVLARTYVNGAGEHVMLLVAWGGDQSDALKAHRQEVCYAAQGFAVGGLERATVHAGARAIPATRFLAVRGARAEPVTYWFTMGDRVVRGRVQRLAVQLRDGFAGRVPDGMLVRVSSLSRHAPRAWAAQDAFVAAMLAAMPRPAARRLAGAPAGEGA